MSNKKVLFILFLSLCFVNGVKADGKALIVEFSDGSKSSFVLAEQPVLTFAEHKMRIGLAENSIAFELTDVARFYFDENAVPTSLEDRQEEKAFKVCCQNNEKVIIENLCENGRVSLSGIDGKHYQANVSTEGNQTVISLTSLPKGVFIIQINNQSIKILKQ